MPYNTTAIPPRKEATGTTQLPLSRVKKIIAQDNDIAMCSNNAAFVITLAAELFIQHLADEAHTQAKLERKPRRNIQYKDIANAVSHQDNLEFLEDMVPKTVPFKKIKAASATAQSRIKGEVKPSDEAAVAAAAVALPARPMTAQSNGNNSTLIINGDDGDTSGLPRMQAAVPVMTMDEDPSEQLALEMRQAQGSHRDGDVHMSG